MGIGTDGQIFGAQSALQEPLAALAVPNSKFPAPNLDDVTSLQVVREPDHVDIFSDLLEFVALDAAQGDVNLRLVYDHAIRQSDGHIALSPTTPKTMSLRTIADTFCTLHNLFADLASGTPQARFTHAQCETRWTYQWLIVNDLLPQICDPGILAKTLASNALVFDAAQFGTALDLGPAFQALCGSKTTPDLSNVTSLFDVTGDPRFLNKPRAQSCAAFWTTDTGPAFNMDGSFDARRSHKVVSATHKDLAGLPSITTCFDTFAAHNFAIAKIGGLSTDLPFANYIDAEADAWTGGRVFGPLGSTVIADTLVGMIRQTPGAYLAQSDTNRPHWHPQSGLVPATGAVQSFEALALATRVA